MENKRHSLNFKTAMVPVVFVKAYSMTPLLAHSKLVMQPLKFPRLTQDSLSAGQQTECLVVVARQHAVNIFWRNFRPQIVGLHHTNGEMRVLLKKPGYTQWGGSHRTRLPLNKSKIAAALLIWHLPPGKRLIIPASK